MVKSINEVLLFNCDDDKRKYLELLKKYKDIYSFKIYAYCLMSNHGHIMIDTNGADISKIMQSINLSYVQYYNRKYKRNGHLFQDRFKSKVVNSTSYLLNLSAYIHNNPCQIHGYENSIEEYPYSSLGMYLGLRKNFLSLVEEDFVISKFNENKFKAKTQYLIFVKRSTDTIIESDSEFENAQSEYRSEREVLIRDFSPEAVTDFVSSFLGFNKDILFIKNSRANKELLALSILLMRGLCDMKIKDICKYLQNITQPSVSQLCFLGLSLINTKDSYSNIISNFLSIQNQ